MAIGGSGSRGATGWAPGSLVRLACALAAVLAASCSGSCENQVDHSQPPPPARRVELAPTAQAPESAPGEDSLAAEPPPEESAEEQPEEDPYGGLRAVPLPETFPRDVPNFASVPGKDSRIVAALSRPGQGQAVTLRSHEPPEEIFAYYKSELQEEGWQIESELDRPRQRMLTSTKAGRRVSLTIITDEDGTLSQVLLTIAENRG